MTRATDAPPREGLKVARLLMVLSSISPLFILWAIRGTRLIPDRWFLGACAAMVVAPNLVLWLRVRTAKKEHDQREITVGSAEDHRDHVLVYLFAMLLPFYSDAIGSWRQLGATLAALSFIVFLFWNMNLHYMNIMFAALKYRTFTVYPPADNNEFSDKLPVILITRRSTLTVGDRIIADRLSDTVYLERI